MNKIENYHKAVEQLAQAVQAFQSAPDDTLYRDGLIQRFEFTFEMAWKSAREYLQEQGIVVPVATPRAVFKQAYAVEILDAQEPWLHILDARNLTSHVYDEDTAIDVANLICTEFLPVFQQLDHFYCAQ